MAQGRIPLLAFTRKRDTAVKLDAFERGADDIVEVPFTLDEIVARPYALIRRAKGTSMGMAINAVKDGKAAAALSAGNTGALMAIAKLALRKSAYG